jgi:hypothetical protein
MYDFGKEIHQSCIEEQSNKPDDAVYQKLYLAVDCFDEKNELFAQYIIYC